MTVVSFLHQKGGTGKSTLAISAAMTLTRAGQRVLLLDADYQGTASEWGNRFGLAQGVEVRSQVQPIVHTELPRFAAGFDWIVVDGPPSLSPMTESILRASERVIIPVRPALPDLWAVPWLAAVIRKLQQEGQSLQAFVVFNQHNGEKLAPLRDELEPWHLPVHPLPLPAHPAFAAVFDGELLPAALAESVLALVRGEGL